MAADANLDGEWLPMEQPPLLKLLQNILREYPADAQIIHELIQNAEDAEATVMKIMYEPRESNPSLHQKYFQSPALIIHNNAVFKKDDWKNIRSVCMSQKEAEADKIGKYGQGFKSVFHLTDHPVVISGDKVLLINPFEHLSCGYYNLGSILSGRSVCSDIMMSAFDLFELKEESMQNGFYHGTLFWFPLRQQESELSKNIPSDDKMTKLLKGFSGDASIVLLFLYHLRQVQIYDSNTQGQILKVEKEENTCAFSFDQLFELPDKIPRSVIAKQVKIVTETQVDLIELDDWVIVNYEAPSETMSEEIAVSDEDTETPCLPFITVAFDKNNPTHSGRVFNYLPLPATCITGLPINLHGPFAVNQNRSQLKFPDGRSQDKYVKWNESIIKLLPEVYKYLILYLISKSENTEPGVSRVLKCFPDDQKTESLWKPFVEAVYGKLLELPIFYTELKEKSWIFKERALIFPDSFATNPENNEEMRNAVKLLLLDQRRPATSMTENMTSILSRTKIDEIKPLTVAKHLKESTTIYSRYTDDIKHRLLAYILQDLSIDFSGIELLPLQNMTYEEFYILESDDTTEKTFLMSSDHQRLFHGMEHRIICTALMSNETLNGLREVAESEIYQLRLLTFEDLPNLLTTIFDALLTTEDDISYIQVAEACPLDKEWIKSVWKMISSFNPQSLEDFEHLPLIPKFITNSMTGESCIQTFFTLKKMIMFSSYEGCRQIPKIIEEILASEGVVVLDYPCEFIQFAKDLLVGEYIKLPTFDTLIDLCRNKIDLQRRIQNILGFKRTLEIPSSENTSAVAFGQKEELTTRIKGILSDHPLDHSFLNELLQNADDAEASQIHFVYDMRNHKNDGIFDERWEPLLGPALCVFNDACFTESDIQGIQDLGLGSKGNDDSKTGKFGIGFNAVYHITDTPSFITKGPDVPNHGVFCVFDPHCMYAPYAHYDNPGMRMDLDELEMRYFGVYKTHLIDKLKCDRGTWFRFPLRNETTAKQSKIRNDTYARDEVLGLLKTMKQFITESLTYLLNVKSICISVIDMETGQMSTNMAEVNLNDTDMSKRMNFAKCVKEHAKLLSSTIFNSNTFEEVQYQIEVRQTNKDPKIFKVVQNIGFKTTDKSILHLPNKLKRLPLGGAAIQIYPLEVNECTLGGDETYPTSSYRVFNTLPLPTSSGLFFHINGHFELGSSRLQLFDATTNDPKYKWNQAVIQYIVSHAVVRCIIELKQSIFSTHTTTLRKMNQFLSHLPVFDLVTHHYWRELTYWVYYYMKTTSVEIFPVFPTIAACTNASEEDHLPVKWVSEGSTNDVFIDNLSDQILPEYRDDLDEKLVECQQLRKLLVDLGVKLISLPSQLRETLSKACKCHNQRHLPLDSNCICKENISPKSVAAFFRANDVTLQGSFTAQRCSFDALVYCCSYLLRGLDYNAIVGLPVLLTNNGSIQRVCRENDLFLSEYCDLLKGSGECFVHKSLQDVFSKFNSKSKYKGMFKPFGLREFSQLLPKSLDEEIFRGKDMIKWANCKHLISDEWIEEFLKFLNTPMVDAKSILQYFINWCLLPAKLAAEQVLVPIGKSRIIDFTTFRQSSKLKTALQKLGIPEPTRHLKDLPSLIATYANTVNVFDCFEYWLTMGTGIILNPEDYASILSYLGGRADDLSSDAIERLKQLSVFESFTGYMTNVSIGTTLVIPTIPEMPSNGLDRLFQLLNVTAIKYSSGAELLYKKLGVKVHAKNSIASQTSDLYTKWILPNFDKLPSESRILHLEFITNNMLEDRQTLVELKKTPFIEVSGHLKPASEFYDRKHKLFKKLCLESEFPPAPFNGKKWRKFMDEAGIQKEVSENILIEFAQRLSNSTTSTEMDISKSLVEEVFRFLEKNKEGNDTSFIQNISTIPFIVPQEPGEEYEKIFAGAGNREMMQFSGSLSYHCYNRVWSAAQTLPSYTVNEKMSIKLGIQIILNEDTVLQHVENICNSLHSSCQNHKQSVLQNIMEEIYKFFNGQFLENELQNNTLSRLSRLPIIHVLANKKFVEAHRVVKYLPDGHEIIPYLMQAPEEYGVYFDFFRVIGMHATATFQTYCRVLNDIYDTVGSHKLEPNQIRDVEKAIRGLIQILNSPNEIEKGEHVLILMTADQRLMPSSQICFETNESDRQRLSEESVNVNLIADMSIVDLSPDQMESLFCRLPAEHRPHPVTSIISEEVITPFDIVETDLAEELHHFLTSSHFVAAVLRFANVYALSNGKKFKQEEIIDIISDIKSMQLYCINDLRTVLVFEGNNLETTIRSKGCFLDNVHGRLYIHSTPTNARTWLSKYDMQLSCALKKICKGQIHKDDLLKIVTKIDLLPAEIIERLDYINLPQLEEEYIQPTWVPSPGSLVPTELYRFIQHPTTAIEPKQYVVYNDSTASAASYKYAVVIESCYSPDEMLERYLLNIGDLIPHKMDSQNVFVIENVTNENLLNTLDLFKKIDDNTISRNEDNTLRAAVLSRNLCQPNPQPLEGKRWLQQASLDLEVGETLLKGLLLDNINGFNWICIICHQAAEKAIKAAMYSIDAEKVIRTHDLQENIPESDIDLPAYASQLTSITGRIERMRYPLYDALPADLYNEDQAHRALDLTEKILKIVQEQYIE